MVVIHYEEALYEVYAPLPLISMSDPEPAFQDHATKMNF